MTKKFRLGAGSFAATESVIERISQPIIIDGDSLTEETSIKIINRLKKEMQKAAENLAEDMVAKTLDMLERDGLIRVSTDKDGDKEIVPISEIITDALRNVKT